jgi:dihydrodipicolinate synthase/N-acetylneuraminate lyase
MRGVYAIPPTPFDDKGGLDLDGLKSVLDFCIEAGSHGILYPANVSESTTMTDAERIQVAEVAAKHIDGRVPHIVGVSGVSKEHAALFSAHARDIGADGVMAMPPYVRRADKPGLIAYFETIARTAELPVWVQNNSPPIGTPMSMDLVNELFKIDGVNCIKEEVIPSAHHIGAIRAIAGDKLKSVMGGMAARYLLQEYRRGVDGTMPACEVVDLQVKVWNLLEAGEMEAARHLFTQILPILTMEPIYGAVFYKEVLYRRGIIRDRYVREAAWPRFDEHDHAELDAILGHVAEHFDIYKPRAHLA